MSTPPDFVDPNPDYWDEYTNLQHVKHELIRRYLGGWYPKLGSWSPRVLYVDTHAGRGRHRAGQLGSPLVALNTLLDHSHRDRLLRSCEFSFHFVERDQANHEALQREIAELRRLPPRVRVSSSVGDGFSVVQRILGSIRETGSRLAPAFVFVDPYGFRIATAALSELMRAGRVELFINLMWRQLGMAITQAREGRMAADSIDLAFGGPEWRTRISGDSFETQAEAAVDLLATRIGGRWATHVRMLGENRQTRYILLHLTNHDEGRDLMKDCVWRVCPDGSFAARRSDDPAQQLLITPRPGLSPLRHWILERLRIEPLRWHEVLRRARETMWLDKHVNEVVRALKKEGKLDGSDFEGRFGARANPLLFLTGSGRGDC